ncbi:MAG TPA: hypothetical protein VM487_01965 [Phycisphaerae bacterium]|nr:hypothetical protein [Phycisphaerae bacterium]
MNKKQLAILAHLASDGPKTPTRIGIEIGGKNYNGASAWSCSTLKLLEGRGLVARNGGRAGPWSITPEGRDVVRAAI